MDWTWYLFGFEGRINRGKWWLSLPVLIGWLLFLLWMTVLGDHIAPGGRPQKINIGTHELFALIDRAVHHSLSRNDIVALPANLFGIATLMWMLLAISIKRLHDRDRSGWWIVPFVVLPIVYNDLVDWLPTQYLPDWLEALTLTVLGAIVFILWIGGFVEMGLLRGSLGTNRFGPDPLAVATSIKSTLGWWIIVPFFVLPGLLYFPIFTVLLGSIILILRIWGWRPLARIDTRPPQDQQSEIELVPHIGSPPSAMHVNPDT